jgi:uncharacterized protein YijF (DUF1287 family)
LALLGALPDRGIFPELTEQVNLGRPVAATRPWLRVDAKHGLVTLYDGDDPLKLYVMVARTATGSTDGSAAEAAHSATASDAQGPTASDAHELASSDAHSLTAGDAHGLAASDAHSLTASDAHGLAAGDGRELAAVAGIDVNTVNEAPPRGEDRDGDGIVDRLDILIGAKKLLHNGARYTERYVSMPYPNGDVPRTEGACSDTVIRALRNAGIDLQKEVHQDILRAPTAYPMVEKVDASINHRRVHTLLPWFVRHWRSLPATERYLPGDVVFFDTFPRREGPDHLGVVSDTVAATGNALIINNWTEGATDAEMDLLAFVPVTHHFRLPSPASLGATALRAGRSQSR